MANPICTSKFCGILNQKYYIVIFDCVFLFLNFFLPVCWYSKQIFTVNSTEFSRITFLRISKFHWHPAKDCGTARNFCFLWLWMVFGCNACYYLLWWISELKFEKYTIYHWNFYFLPFFFRKFIPSNMLC